MFFLFVEGVPVTGVVVEIDLICGPEGGEMLFVHLVDGVVFDGEEDEAVGVGFEDGFGEFVGFEDCGRIHDVSV